MTFLFFSIMSTKQTNSDDAPRTCLRGRLADGSVISMTKRTLLTPPVNDVKHMRFLPRARTASSRVIIIMTRYADELTRVHSSSSTPGGITADLWRRTPPKKAAKSRSCYAVRYIRSDVRQSSCLRAGNPVYVRLEWPRRSSKLPSWKPTDGGNFFLANFRLNGKRFDRREISIARTSATTNVINGSTCQRNRDEKRRTRK